MWGLRNKVWEFDVIFHVLWFFTRETDLSMLFSFTEVVKVNGYDVYSLFLVDEILSFVVPGNVWHICSNVCTIFCRENEVKFSNVFHYPTIYDCESTRNKAYLSCHTVSIIVQA